MSDDLRGAPRCPTCGQRLVTRGEWANMLRLMARLAGPEDAERLRAQAAALESDPDAPLNFPAAAEEVRHGG